MVKLSLLHLGLDTMCWKDKFKVWLMVKCFRHFSSYFRVCRNQTDFRSNQRVPLVYAHSCMCNHEGMHIQHVVILFWGECITDVRFWLCGSCTKNWRVYNLNWENCIWCCRVVLTKAPTATSVMYLYSELQTRFEHVCFCWNSFVPSSRMHSFEVFHSDV